MPLPLIAIILVAAVSLTVVVVAIVLFRDIIRWFQARNAIKEADKDNIAFTIKQNLENGDYKVVQGIFNTQTNELVDGHVMQTHQLDSQFEQAHADNELVLYE